MIINYANKVIKSIVDKYHKIAIQVNNAGDEDKNKESFIRFLDILYNILLCFFIVFSCFAAYFFTTRVIL